MSARRLDSSPSNGGRAAAAALAVVAIAIAMMLLLRARPTTQPFDPRSGAANGTRGLVVLLQQYGADVQISRSVPAPGTDRRLLVIQDRLTDLQRASLHQVVERGGTVVVADPLSPIGDPHSATVIDSRGTTLGSQRDLQINLELGTCDIAALAHLRGVHVVNGIQRTVEAGDRSCFGDGRDSFAVARHSGNGVIVALGDNAIFTNAYLRLADNAGVATALLAPVKGTKVTIVLGDAAPKTVADIGTGTRGLADLVRPGVWMALVQLAVAFIVLAVARAVRPGKPVREPEQVPIAGSELVVATGRLMHRARHEQRAAWLLRGDLYRDLCAHHHLPPTTPVDALDRAVSERSGLAPGAVADVLGRDATDATRVVDATQLLELSRTIQQIRDHVLQGASR
jgi:hypothetical protein